MGIGCLALVGDGLGLLTCTGWVADKEWPCTVCRTLSSEKLYNVGVDLEKIKVIERLLL